MSDNFQWHTDEEEGWDEPLPTRVSPSRRRPWLLSRWRLLLPLVLATILMGVLSMRQYRQRLSGVERDVTADLLSGTKMIRRAILERDVELFRLNLSGRNPNWTEAQIALLEQQHFLSRKTFGLAWTGSVTEPVVDSVTLAPDLRSGQAPLLVSYERASPVDEAGTVRLQIDQVYRQSDDGRWLLAPPLEPYWGPWQRVDLGPLEIFVSRRDADLVERLANDLRPDVALLCAALDDCPSVTIWLEREPAALLDLAGESWMLTAGERSAPVALPTPSLVGTPVDDSGYTALLDGYRRHFLGTIYARSLKVRCCRNGLLLQAYVDYRLAQLALGTWPMRPEQYGELLTRWRSPDDLEALFQAPADAGLQGTQWPAAYALIDYGFTNFPESARVGMEDKLANLATFAGLLRHLMPLDDRERPLAWATFLNTRQEAGAPVWPDGYHMTLGCRSQASFFDVALYDFGPNRGLKRAGTVEGPANLFKTSDIDGYIVQRFRTIDGENVPQVSYWYQGEEMPVNPGRSEQILALGYESWTRILPMGYESRTQTLERFIPLWQMSTNGSAESPNFALLDAATCSSGTCTTTPVPGFPNVAPGGRHALVINFGDNRNDSVGLSSTDTPEEITWLPRTRWAFWISHNRFATIDWEGTVRVATVNAPFESRIVITADELVAGLPDEMSLPAGQVEISDGFANPTDPDQLYFFISLDRGFSNRSTALLMHYNATTGNMTIVDASPSTYYLPQFSPDGRWLALWSDPQGRYRQVSTLTILDTMRPEIPTLELSAASNVSVRWLPEGNRLLINHGRFARLYAPENNRTALFALPNGLWCQQAFWQPLATE